MKIINLEDVRQGIADTKLVGHAETKDGVVRQEMAKVGKRGGGPQRD